MRDFAVGSRAYARKLWAGDQFAASLYVGLCGSTLLAFASLFVGRVAPTPVAAPLLWMQARPHAVPVAVCLQTVGLVLLTVAWWRLRVCVRGAVDGVHRSVIAALAWFIPLFLTPPMFSDDVWSYVANGMIMARHASPYEVAPAALNGPILEAVSARWIYSPAPYGPLPLWLGGLFASSTGSLWMQLFAFRLLAVASLLVVAVAVGQIARATGVDKGTAAWIAVASPFTLVHGLDSAHLDLLIAALCASAVALALRKNLFWASVLVGLAASVKFPVLVIALPVALAGLPRDTSLAVKLSRSAVVGVVAAAVVWLGGVWSHLGLGWLQGLSAPLSDRTPMALSADLLRGTPLSSLDQYLAPVALALIGAWMIRTPRAWTAPRVVASVLALTVTELVLSPVLHLWYFFWCLPFLLALPMRPALSRMMVAFTVSFGFLAIDNYSLHLPLFRTTLYTGMALPILAAIDPRTVRALRRHWGTWARGSRRRAMGARVVDETVVTAARAPADT